MSGCEALNIVAVRNRVVDIDGLLVFAGDLKDQPNVKYYVG